MARPEVQPVNAVPPGLPDLSRTLEQQIAAGFPKELALDLALHELVLRAASLTQASAAALALARGEEMVCRAATGLHAPDLGVPLNTHTGLSGACLRTRQAQLCADAEADPRVDATAAHRLGIRSMLIVPVFEADAIIGVLEVFSSQPAAFSQEHEALLETCAAECARVRRGVLELQTQPHPASHFMSIVPPVDLEKVLVPEASSGVQPTPSSATLSRPYDGWTLLIGTLAILAAIGVSFLIGSRIGWVRATFSNTRSKVSAPISAIRREPPVPPAPTPSTAAGAAPAKAGGTKSKPDELVVYEQGKVIFRMKPAPKNGDSVVAASESVRLKSAIVWLAPDQAERRLRSRVEPTYPPEALATHRSGEVVLELLVAEDGAVASVRTLSGDPILAAAAASAVRNWRYDPYRANQHPAPFQTDVTLRFSLPE